MVSFEFLRESPFEPSVKHKLWLHRVIRHEGKIPGDISYIFCDDEYMLERNISFLNHDTYTDIITFDECEGDIVSGSILISLERVGENASKFGKTFQKSSSESWCMELCIFVDIKIKQMKKQSRCV